MEKLVYQFGMKVNEGNSKMKDLLGGKGANLAEICNLGIAVPPGFTITTEVCNHYYTVTSRRREAASGPLLLSLPFQEGLH